MKILILGGGNMGLTYAQSFLRSHIVTPDNLMVLCRTAEQAASLSASYEGRFFTDAAACVPVADLAILAVKPQDAPALFEQIRSFVSSDQVWLSIMAGVRTATIARALGVRKVARAMPNLPAQIGAGVTAFTATEEVTRIELVMVQNLLSTTGKTLYVEQEALLDAATAISGSGPAYVYFFMEAMIETAQQMGFSAAEAELLVAQTFIGALDLYHKANLSCKEWIRKVASKGGTTEAALRVFEQTQLRHHIYAGLAAAWKRAEELGEIL
ncbi:MAG: pyrroline-5-carboxylate reductase [Saprospiraceae bacterium]|nr:pyrroline-5-carboxylate reductase [Saprospiraceae bacterium]MDW8483138.1 pyrroline-5-carboxylate reductase [Saprospiraceae bacterium]